jgi:hypothetical protein
MFSRNGLTAHCQQSFSPCLIGRVPTHKLAYRLELVEIDALLQAGQALDPEREMQFDMPDKFGGPYRPLWVISAECVNCDRECSRRRIFEEKKIKWSTPGRNSEEKRVKSR